MAESKKKADKPKDEVIKSKFWAAEVYPDSAPENWKEIIQISGLVAAVSPLHDKDVNPTGEAKKPHWHLILCWEGPTTLNNARKFVMGKLNGPTPFELKSVRGMYNYFTHKDNPEKAQYDEKDIEHINGFCLSTFVELTRGEVNKAIKNAFKIIRDVGIAEYAGLLDFLDDNGLDDEWDVVKNNAYLFNSYIISRNTAEKRIAEECARLEAAKLQAARKAARQNADEKRITTPFD